MADNHSNSGTPKRPILISILSILSALALSFSFLGLLIGLLTNPSMLAANPFGLSLSYLITMGALMPAGIAGSIGIFLMRKWGLYLYGLFTVIGYGINIAFGVNIEIGAQIYGLVFLGIVLAYFKRLR